MNDNSKKWVAALRSGEYNQAKAYLRTVDNRFCCLGVACELAVEAGVIDPGTLSNGSFYSYKDGFQIRMGVLPQLVKEWLGLSANDGKHLSEGKTNYLVSINDDGASFAQIADIIESEPEGLFSK